MDLILPWEYKSLNDQILLVIIWRDLLDEMKSVQYSRHSTRFTLHFPKELQLNAERSVENDRDDPIDSLHESSFNLSVKCQLESTPSSTCILHTARSYVMESLVFVLDTQI